MSNVQIPKGEFRRYIEWEGRWRHVYVVSTHFQQRLFDEPMKMVDFKLTKNSRTVHTAERDRFHTEKPKKRKNVERIA